MARLLCKCGEELSDSVSPNDVNYTVFTDKEWVNIIGLGYIESGDLPDPKYEVWRCPVCERIYVFNEDNQLLKYYVLYNIDELNVQEEVTVRK